jgi:hypothetical protein
MKAVCLNVLRTSSSKNSVTPSSPSAPNPTTQVDGKIQHVLQRDPMHLLNVLQDPEHRIYDKERSRSRAVLRHGRRQAPSPHASTLLEVRDEFT